MKKRCKMKEKSQKIKIVSFKILKETFNEMDNEKGMLGLALIKEAEYMKKIMSGLRKELAKGVVTKMSQGNYSIDRANPALTQYNAIIKNYNSIIKQINDLLPKDSSGNDNDSFDDDDL